MLTSIAYIWFSLVFLIKMLNFLWTIWAILAMDTRCEKDEQQLTRAGWQQTWGCEKVAATGSSAIMITPAACRQLHVATAFGPWGAVSLHCWRRVNVATETLSCGTSDFMDQPLKCNTELGIFSYLIYRNDFIPRRWGDKSVKKIRVPFLPPSWKNPRVGLSDAEGSKMLYNRGAPIADF